MTDASASGVVLTQTASIVDGVASPITVAWLDGFDAYGTATDLSFEYFAVGSFTINTTAGRFGAGAAQLANNGGALRKQIGTSFIQGWMGFAHRRDRVSGGDDRIAQWCSGTNGTIELTLTLDNVTGDIKVWRGDKATLLATSTQRVKNPQGIFHFYEWYVSFDSTTGSTEVRVDGASYLLASSLNTRQTAATALSAGQIGSPGFDAVWLYFDDWYITLGPRTGDMRIASRVPTSDATPNDGTPSTGTTHWSLVDENPANTTDYVTLTNVNGNSELYGLSTAPAAAVQIYGVRVTATGLKSSNSAYNISVIAKSSGVSQAGDPLGLAGGTQYSTISWVFLKDPATGVGWTTSGAAAMTAGFKVAVV